VPGEEQLRVICRFTHSKRVVAMLQVCETAQLHLQDVEAFSQHRSSFAEMANSLRLLLVAVLLQASGAFALS
jgi:hypothetical protein